MCKVSIWCSPPNFKIRRKSDVYYFLEKCLVNGGEYAISIRSDYCLFIRKSKDGECTATAKFNDLTDIFNPEIQLSEEETIRTLWFYRKIINEQFFK